MQTKTYLKNIVLKYIKLILILSKLWGKIKVDKNGHEYLRFRIDVCCSKYNLAVEVDEKRHADRDLIFEKKRQEALKKN